jgi:hypothetical protein
MRTRRLHIMFVALVAATLGCSNASVEQVDAPPSPPDAPPPIDVLVINEIAPAGDPDDWFEVVNVGDHVVTLSDYVFVDGDGAIDDAVPLDGTALAPGAYAVQVVSDASVGFGLGSDEALSLYHSATATLIDSHDWADGDAGDGESLARLPDATGAFATVDAPTPGRAN